MCVWLAVRVAVAVMAFSSAGGVVLAAGAAAAGLVGADGLRVVQVQQGRVHGKKSPTGSRLDPGRWQASSRWDFGTGEVWPAPVGARRARRR